jgi:hypothetical protein
LFAVLERSVSVHIFPLNDTGLPVAEITSVNSDEQYASLRSWFFPTFWRALRDEFVFVDENGEDITMEKTTAPDKVYLRIAA